MLCVCCVQRRVVEGSGVGSGGCVVHFMYTKSVECCGLLQCSAILSMADIVCLDCMQKLCSHEQCWVCMACRRLSYAVKFYCC